MKLLKMDVQNKDSMGTKQVEENSQAATVSTFGSSATGFSSGFGQPANTVFGNFSNNNNNQPQQQQQGFGQASGTTFGGQQTFGHNFLQCPGFFKPPKFPFDRSIPSQYTTNICFTGFGEPKTNYCFANSFNPHTKKITLIFDSEDSIFGSSLFGKPNTIVEIEGQPTSNRLWTSSNNDFSFTVGHIEKFNSIYVLKSPQPLRYIIKVKQPNTNTMSTLRNKKITLTFQSPQTHNSRQTETIVEVPLNCNQTFPMNSVSMDETMFSVGPYPSNQNAFEVQTSKNEVFKITFAEINNTPFFGNRKTRTGSVYFDQGRQLNAFPFSTSNGSPYASHFGHGTNNQSTSFGSSAATSSSSSGLFGKPATSQLFGSSFVAPTGKPFFGSQSQPIANAGISFGNQQAFGNGDVTGTATAFGQPMNHNKSVEMQNHANAGISFGNQQAFGNGGVTGTVTAFGQPMNHNKSVEMQNHNSAPSPLFGEAKNIMHASPFFGEGNNLQSFTKDSPNNQGYIFGANPSFEIDPTVKYQPTFSNEPTSNQGVLNIKTNCITAMREFQNHSLEELRYDEYSRSHCQPPPPLPPKPQQQQQTQQQNDWSQTYGSFVRNEQNQNNTNKEFFDQLHKLIPYLNAGSFCKCYRSSSATKNPSASTTNQTSSSKTSNDSHDQLFGNTQKPRHNVDNMNINEFYEDVFKYLDYIQKQYRHLETTLNNKNVTSADKEEDKANESNVKSPKHKEPKTKAVLPLSKQKSTTAKPIIFGSSPLDGKKVKQIREQTATLESEAKTHSNNNNKSEESPKEKNMPAATGAIKKITSNSPTKQTTSASLNFGFSLKDTNDKNTAEKSKVNESKQSGIKFDSPAVLFKDAAAASNSNADEKSIKQAGITFGCPPVLFKDVACKSNSKDESKNTENRQTDFAFGCPPISFKDDDDDKSKNTDFKQTGGFSFNWSVASTNLINSKICKVPSKSTEITYCGPTSFTAGNFSFPLMTTGTSNNPNAKTDEEEPKKNESFSGFTTFAALGNSNTNSPHLPASSSSKICSKEVETNVDDKVTKNTNKTPEMCEKTTGIFLSDNPSKTRPNTSNPMFFFKESTPAIQGGFMSIFGRSHPFVWENEASKNAEIENNTKKHIDSIDGGQKKCKSSSKALDMKKISEELAALEAKENLVDGNRRNSVTKSEADSEHSNSSYCLIENEEDGENNASAIETEEHPTGIKMTRYGYYTEPPLEQLTALIADDGTCVVPNFTIGRKGYGSIHFESEINVAGLDIDELVHFRNKEIIIFPNVNNRNQSIENNNLKKSSVLVVLKQVWPLDKIKQEPIKDPQILESIRYEDRLRLACQKNNIHFVKYRPQTGCWIFKMKELTKCIINCWNEEDEELTEENEMLSNMNGITEIFGPYTTYR